MDNIPEPITIAGNIYRIGRLTPRQQFHIVRRLGPALLAWTTMKAADDPVLALAPIVDAISKLSDTDSEYVLDNCLGAVLREQNGSWARVGASNGQVMFKDIELPVMMQLVFAVIKENLGNFSDALPAT